MFANVVEIRNSQLLKPRKHFLSYGMLCGSMMNMVSFRTYLHVPELHPETGMTFMEREDEGHVLKVYIHTNICDCTCINQPLGRIFQN